MAKLADQQDFDFSYCVYMASLYSFDFDPDAMAERPSYHHHVPPLPAFLFRPGPNVEGLELSLITEFSSLEATVRHPRDKASPMAFRQYYKLALYRNPSCTLLE